jgi:putative heme-binding domain-containing protein
MKHDTLCFMLCLAIAALSSGAIKAGAADADEPPAKTKDGKNAIDFDALSKLPGNADKGEAVFRNDKGANCVNCHQIGGKGNNVGPPLDAIGEKPKEVIFESILKPSAAIQHGFETCTVKLKTGAVMLGLLIQDGDDIILRTQDGVDHEISGADIAKKAIQEQSMMPEGLAGTMTLQELLDLVAWLSKQSVNK